MPRSWPAERQEGQLKFVSMGVSGYSQVESIQMISVRIESAAGRQSESEETMRNRSLSRGVFSEAAVTARVVDGDACQDFGGFASTASFLNNSLASHRQTQRRATPQQLKHLPPLQHPANLFLPHTQLERPSFDKSAVHRRNAQYIRLECDAQRPASLDDRARDDKVVRADDGRRGRVVRYRFWAKVTRQVRRGFQEVCNSWVQARVAVDLQRGTE